MDLPGDLVKQQLQICSRSPVGACGLPDGCKTLHARVLVRALWVMAQRPGGLTVRDLVWLVETCAW